VETVRLLRNVFLRSFVVGAVLALLSVIVTMGGWNTWMPFAARLFHTDPLTLALVVLQFFVGLRFFLYFCLLTPAIALHWTLKAEARRIRRGLP
jgi:hypothetical protein